MGDYILRSDAVQCANDLSVDLLNDRLDSASYGAQAVAEWLKDLPTADVRPVVMGKWKERRFSEDVYGAECSVCHTTWDYGTNFCPNCGADMRPETPEEG